MPKRTKDFGQIKIFLKIKMHLAVKYWFKYGNLIPLLSNMLPVTVAVDKMMYKEEEFARDNLFMFLITDII